MAYPTRSKAPTGARAKLVLTTSPPLKSAESDHNLVYATVRIPRRSAPNRRRRECTKATQKTVDLQRLMDDPDLRRQVACAINEALSPIPNGTGISDIAADMADLTLSTSAKIAPRSKRPRGP